MNANGLFITLMSYECGNNSTLEASFNGFFLLIEKNLKNDFFLLIWHILNYSVELYIIFIHILRQYFFSYADEWICGKILKKCCHGN